MIWIWLTIFILFILSVIYINFKVLTNKDKYRKIKKQTFLIKEQINKTKE